MKKYKFLIYALIFSATFFFVWTDKTQAQEVVLSNPWTFGACVSFDGSPATTEKGIVQTFSNLDVESIVEFDLYGIGHSIENERKPTTILCEGIFDDTANFNTTYTSDPWPTWGRTPKCASGDTAILSTIGGGKKWNDYGFSTTTYQWQKSYYYNTYNPTTTDFYLISLLDTTTNEEYELCYNSVDYYSDGVGYFTNQATNEIFKINESGGDWAFKLYGTSTSEFFGDIDSPSTGNYNEINLDLIRSFLGNCNEDKELFLSEENYCDTGEDNNDYFQNAWYPITCNDGSYAVAVDAIENNATSTIYLLDWDRLVSGYNETCYEDYVQLSITNSCPEGEYYNQASETCVSWERVEFGSWCDDVEFSITDFGQSLKAFACWLFVNNSETKINYLKRNSEEIMTSKVPFAYFSRIYGYWTNASNASTTDSINVDFSQMTPTSSPFHTLEWEIVNFETFDQATGTAELIDYVENDLVPYMEAFFVIGFAFWSFRKLE